MREVPTPHFEKGSTIPPQIKQFDGGIFKGYFYPHLQVVIQKPNLQMPHGEKSFKHVISQDKTKSKTPNQQTLLDKIVKGEDFFNEKTNRWEQRGGLKQNIGHALKEAGITPEELSQRSIPNAKRLEYVEHMQSNKMHGLRNIHFEDRDGHMTAVMDSVGISFPFYRYIRNPDLSEEMLALSNPTGTAAILETSDEKFILQYRRPYDVVKKVGNVMHGGIPGASAAGMWKFNIDEPYANVQSEAHEELGLHIGETRPINPIDQALKITQKELHLGINDIADMFVTGLSGDLAAVHAEVVLLGKLNIDESTLRERFSHGLSFSKDPEYDFEEQFVTIPATSQAIWDLLTSVKCPLPANHIAAFTAAGIAKRQEELLRQFPDMSTHDRQQILDGWYASLEKGIQRNYAEINKMAGGVYDFGRTPSTQDKAVPSFHEEMKRVFNIDFSEEKANASEVLKQPSNAYLFDIDGVLTDPKTKEIMYPQLLREIMYRLVQNKPIGFNTGRSLAFVQEKVLRPLERLLDAHHISQDKLSNLVVIGEKGGVWMTFDQEGNPTTHRDESLIVVPQELKEGVEGLVRNGLRTMFYDSTKQTMLTVEMRDNPTPEQEAEFKIEQQQLVKYINAHLKDSTEFSVDATRIATDVQNVKVGKARGAEIFHNILSQRGITPKNYISFGDSKSDYDMHEALQKLGSPSEFVYVGDRNDLADKDITQVKFTKDNGFDLDRGTYWFLV